MSKKLTGENVIWIQLIISKSNPKFIRAIKKLGFSRTINSVYQRFCLIENVSQNIELVKSAMQASGDVKVHILQFTDNQYGNIITLTKVGERLSDNGAKSRNQY